MKRPDHRRHVAERTPLEAALRLGPRGLSLEVDEDEIVAGPEHLSEVQIAVHADPVDLDPVARDLAEALIDPVLAREEGLDHLASPGTPCARRREGRGRMCARACRAPTGRATAGAWR